METAHRHQQGSLADCPCCALSELALDFREHGTRFRLFPQSPLLSDYQEPETVWVSLSPSEIQPGPADHRMYIVDAIDKTHYENNFLPPYNDQQHPPALPGRDGHYDHLEVGTHQFEAAHMYGTLRWVLDIWETYFQREIEWSFQSQFERLELVPWLDWDNAHAGFGFIEMGYSRDDTGQKFPFNLNFDVLAHELGHTILYSVIGMPDDDKATPAFFAFHETASDMVAIISLLHFNSVLDRLLDETSGNLYIRNILNRVGEESDTRQIRMASNNLQMHHVPSPNTPLEQLSIKQLHEMSLPFTGGLFDLLVEVFQHNLVAENLIDEALDQRSRGFTESTEHQAEIQAMFDQAYMQNSEGFKKALVDARDYLGVLLSLNWEQLSWDLDFPQVVYTLIKADQELTSGHYLDEIEEVFRRRKIPF